MADDSRMTLRELPTGTVFRTDDGRTWRVGAAPALSGNPEEVWCQYVSTGTPGGECLLYGTPVEPLDLPALLSELDELRTLTHDLLIDRDASVGREVGRGEAARAIAALRARVEDAWGGGGQVRKSCLVAGLAAAYGAVEDLGPVRPPPPPERVVERCRELEGALRGLTKAVGELLGDPAQTFAGVAAAGELLKARGAALGLLGETSAGK
jgi:hypothetical protein